MLLFFLQEVTCDTQTPHQQDKGSHNLNSKYPGHQPHPLQSQSRLSSTISTFCPEMSFDSKLPSAEGADPELQGFIQMETQRAQFQGQVHKLTDLCWDQCVDKPRDKLDSRTETCMSNCVERFIDTSLSIATRFQKILQGN